MAKANYNDGYGEEECDEDFFGILAGGYHSDNDSDNENQYVKALNEAKCKTCSSVASGQ